MLEHNELPINALHENNKSLLTQRVEEIHVVTPVGDNSILPGHTVRVPLFLGLIVRGLRIRVLGGP